MGLDFREGTLNRKDNYNFLCDIDYNNKIHVPLDISLILTEKITFSDISKIDTMGVEIVFIGLQNTFNGFDNDLQVKENIEVASSNTKSNIALFSEFFVEQLKRCDFDEIIETIIYNNKTSITQANIPQFSNFADGTNRLITILRKSGNYGPIFDDIGLYLTNPGKKTAAYKKYGENHSKLSELFDLTYIIRKGGARQVYLTELGKVIEKMQEESSKNIIAKLAIKIPIIKKLIESALTGEVSIESVLSNYLSASTVIRRRPNVKYIINLIKDEYDGTKYTKALDNIK